jgi:hypothetical protein
MGVGKRPETARTRTGCIRVNILKGLKRKCLFSFSRKSFNYFRGNNSISCKNKESFQAATHIFAKKSFKYFSKIGPVVSYVADKFCLFCNKLKKKSTFVNLRERLPSVNAVARILLICFLTVFPYYPNIHLTTFRVVSLYDELLSVNRTNETRLKFRRISRNMFSLFLSSSKEPLRMQNIKTD